MNTRSPFLKRRAFSLIFAMAGLLLALFAAANPDILSRENAPHTNAEARGPNTLSVGVQEAWVAHYNGLGGNSEDTAWAIAVDGSGNVYVTGASVGPAGNNDYVTIKYNSAGQEQWVARYNGPGNSDDAAAGMAIDGSGNVYVTGSSIGVATSSDYATIKYNSAGQEQWVARYNGPANLDDYAVGIAIDSSGNIYVTGGDDGPAGNYDYATVKYNSAGQEQWVARYDGPRSISNGDFPAGIAIDGSGNICVTGTSNRGDKGNMPRSSTTRLATNSGLPALIFRPKRQP